MAYRIYMSDTLASFLRIFTNGNYEPQRYYDWIYPEEEKKRETAEETLSHFDKLRRK